MAWTSIPYCTRADVKQMLDPNMSTTDDFFLDYLIGVAQEDIDSELGYSFQQDGTSGSPASRTYDGTGEYWLWVDDLVSLASPGGVMETYYNTYLAGGTTWIAGATQTTDITADIILKPANAPALEVPYHKLQRNSGLNFAAGTNNYVVSGIFGQPILADQMYPGVPNDLSRACARLVIFYYRMRDTAYADMVQAQGGVRQHYLKTWPVDVQHVVNNYQRTRFYTHGGL
jgi:hypothetical protein